MPRHAAETVVDAAMEGKGCVTTIEKGAYFNEER
jgi:hypothetical protein